MLSRRDINYMDTVMRHAIDVSPVGGAKCSAILVIRNRIISFGHNQRKSHPLQAEYGRNIEAINLHAEIDSIRNALRMKSFHVDDFRRSTLYVGRVKHKTGSPTSPYVWGMAKPCRNGCDMAIDAFNISRVVYSKDDQSFGVMI